jgi:predicted CopG family antitoxin
MIKLGIIVDQTITRSVLQAVSHLPDVDLKGIYFSGGAAVSDQFNVIYNPGELMDSSDTILVLGEKSLSPDMVRQLIRRSKRLFLHALPEASAADINEIIKLEREAGFSCRLFSTFFSCSQFEIFQQKERDSPELVQVRTCFHGAQKMGNPNSAADAWLCKKAQTIRNGRCV